MNRAKKLRQTVRNEAFLARGGSCRRVVYVPSRSVNELRYTGRYQIEKSAEDARELTGSRSQGAWTPSRWTAWSCHSRGWACGGRSA